MKIKINGESVEVIEKQNLSVLIKQRMNNDEPRGIAVALNDYIVPKSKWGETEVKENDNIEIVHAVQGG